ncbi:MAG: EamA family transporter [Geodermatophilaceae bacterium]|nr:EamA family transporter [Geodermatophilaceae bacterium]
MTVETARRPAAPTVTRPLAVAVALGIVYVVWGSTYLAIGIVVETMPSLTSAGARFFLAGLVMAAVLTLRSGWRRLAVTRVQLLGASLVGLLLPTAGNGLVTVGEDLGTPTGIASLMVASVPLWVVFYRLLSGDRPRSATIGGVLVGFGGLAALVAAIGVTGTIPLGPTLLVALAAMCWSFGSWLQPRLHLPSDPFVTTVYEMVAGGLALLVAGLVAGERVDLTAYSGRSWLAWGYLLVFGSLVAFSAYVWVLASAPISLVATYAYVNPVVALFLGWIVLDEALTGSVLGATAVILVGVAVVVGSERHRRPPPPADPCTDPHG